MAKIRINGRQEYEVPDGKRLVLALIDEGGVDQLHSCGGKAKCTTCRVKFVRGEPETMTAAEKSALAAKGVSEPGIRLSCQLLCRGEMELEVVSRLQGSGRKDQGKRPADAIEPPPEWGIK